MSLINVTNNSTSQKPGNRTYQDVDGPKYVYIAYADDNIGTGFSLEPAGKVYMGILVSNSVISPLTVNSFGDNWVRIKGDTGDTGQNGTNGSNGIVTGNKMSLSNFQNDSTETPSYFLKGFNSTIPDFPTKPIIIRNSSHDNINPTYDLIDITSGNIQENHWYRIIGGQITYNSLIYEDRNCFKGLAGITTFTGTGHVYEMVRIITITGIDTVNHTITLSYLPDLNQYESNSNWTLKRLKTPVIGTSGDGYWVSGEIDEISSIEILSYDLNTNTITYNNTNKWVSTFSGIIGRDVSDWAVGDIILYANFNYSYFNSPNNYNKLFTALPAANQKALHPRGFLQLNDGSYILFVVGAGAATGYRTYYYTSPDLVTWTLGTNNSGSFFVSASGYYAYGIGIMAQTIRETSPGNYIAFCQARGTSTDNVNTVTYCTFTDAAFLSGSSYVAPIIAVAPLLGVSSELAASNTNGDFGSNCSVIQTASNAFKLILYNAKQNSVVDGRYEQYTCSSLGGALSFDKTILNCQDYANNDSIWLSSHSAGFTVFKWKGKYLAIVSGSSYFVSSGNITKHFFGLMYLDPIDDTWKMHPQNPLIIQNATIYGWNNFYGVFNVGTNMGHNGGLFALYPDRENDILYLFLSSELVGETNGYKPSVITIDFKKV